MNISHTVISVTSFSVGLYGIIRKLTNHDYIVEYEITRSSATTERQRVSYTRLSRLTHWSCTSL